MGASAPIQSRPVRASMAACHSGIASAAATTPRRANASPRGLPAALSSSISALNGSYSAGTGRSPHPGASTAATAYPLPVTYRRARPAIWGAVLCPPPPWPSSTSGRGPAAPAGAHTAPGTSPTVNRRSVTPSDVVSAINRITTAASQGPPNPPGYHRPPLPPPPQASDGLASTAGARGRYDRAGDER